MISTKNKTLPLAPPYLCELEKQNEILQRRILHLEEVIEVLYKQNLQYSTVLNQRQALENDLTRGLEKALESMINIASVYRQNKSMVRKVEKKATSEWTEYCDQLTNESGDIIGQHLEEIKEQMIERESREVLCMLNTD